MESMKNREAIHVHQSHQASTWGFDLRSMLPRLVLACFSTGERLRDGLCQASNLA
jgi:hypothetical protein